MKKALLGTAAIVLAMALVISSIGAAIAQENSEEGQSQVQALVIEALDVVQVDETVTITVKDRGTGQPVGGAGVYALGWPIRFMPYASADSPTASGRLYFEHLGDTGSDGVVTAIFDRAGRFLLIATKGGYVPGVAGLAVKPNVGGKLEIKAPRRAEVSQPVSINVVEKGSGDRVPGADVWAIGLPVRVSASEAIPSISDVRELLQGLRDLGGDDIAEVLNRHGEHLGQTGDDGSLIATFTEVGGYLLVSTKSGYVPGTKSIAIVTNKALAIDVPKRVSVEEDVTFRVTTRGIGAPVGVVDLYALGRPFAGSLRMTLPTFEDGWGSLRELVVESGMHLGKTDEEGELKNYRFMEGGGYLIVGIKDGYVPGLTFVFVGDFEGFGEMLPKLERFGERIRGRVGERFWEYRS